jgi:hypothetical protein
MSGSLVLALGYGYEVKKSNDPKIYAAEKMIKVVSATALPGALLVNSLPFCEPSCVGIDNFSAHSY